MHVSQIGLTIVYLTVTAVPDSAILGMVHGSLAFVQRTLEVFQTPEVNPDLSNIFILKKLLI